MIIKQIVITSRELNEAVQEWLKKRGLDVNVNEVEKSYAQTGCYNVDSDVKELTPVIPPPTIQSPEQLGEALEQGKV